MDLLSLPHNLSFRLQFEDRLGIVDVVMRVGSIGFGDPEQNEIQIGAVEDTFRTSPNIFAPPPASAYTTINTSPVAVSVQDVFDQDFFFAMRDENRAGELSTEKPLFVAQGPQENALAYALEVRQGTDPYDRQGLVSYLPSGVLQSALVESDGLSAAKAGIELATLVVEDVSDSFLALNVLSTDDIKVNGLNLMLVVSSETNPFTGATYEPELMAFEIHHRHPHR